MAEPRRRCRDQTGAATLLIVGFAMLLLMMVAVVTDASAAYLQRQGLDTLADGAALTGADAGASGGEAYAGGLDADLHLDPGPARAAVFAYLRRADAYARYPGLTVQVSVDSAAQQVSVTVHAPLHLPLKVPGSPDHAMVGSTSVASVHLDP